MKMKDVCIKIGSGSTPKGGKESYVSTGTTLIRSQNVLDFSFSYNGLAFLNEQQALKLNNVIVKKGDVLLNITGDSVARSCIVEENVLPARVNQHVAIVRSNSEIVLNSYLLYYFQTVKPYLLQLAAGGATRNALTKGMIEDLLIEVPDINIQRKITSVLDVIQGKIKINQKINENLAEQAQGILYHFMDKHPYQLQPLSDIAIVIDCLHSKKPSSTEDSIYQLIQLDNIRDDGFLDLSATRYMISQTDYEIWTRKCEIIEGDCVITNVGRIGAVSQAPYGTKAAMGRNMTCIRLKPEIKLHAYFITVLLSNHMKRQIQGNTDEGTIMGALNVKNIPKLLFPIFESAVMTELEGVLFPLRKQIEYNNLQNQTLAQLRNVLLPKLMSGELDVSNFDI